MPRDNRMWKLMLDEGGNKVMVNRAGEAIQRFNEGLQLWERVPDGPPPAPPQLEDEILVELEPEEGVILGLEEQPQGAFVEPPGWHFQPAGLQHLFQHAGIPAPKFKKRIEDQNFDHLPLLEDQEMTKTVSSSNIETPPFWMEYETREEMNTRLSHSIITYKGKPFYVHDVTADKQLVGYGTNENMSRLPFKKNTGLNLRSIEPGYVQGQGTDAFYLCRLPARVYRQGITSQNSRLIRVGNRDMIQWPSIKWMMDAIASRTIQPYGKDVLDRLMENKADNGRHCASVMLSPSVAVGAKKNKLFVEFMGRYLGHFNGFDTVQLDTDDLRRPWILERLNEVKLQVVK
jgi:hypothetical protein